MNIIMNYLDINDRATSLLSSIPELDYGQISFDLSRITYFVFIDGDEEASSDEALFLYSVRKAKPTSSYVESHTKKHSLKAVYEIYERELGVSEFHYIL
jgi:hypothetical protein